MQKNFIIVNQLTFSSLKVLLQNWLVDNSAALLSEQILEISFIETERHVINPMPQLDNQLFYSLILQLRNFQQENGKSSVLGFTTLKAMDNSADAEGKPALIFTIEDSSFGELHAVTTDGRGFRIMSDGTFNEESPLRSYYEPVLSNSKKSEVISREIIKDKPKKKSVIARREKRFTILASLSIGAFVLNFFTLLEGSAGFLINHLYIGGAIASWLLFDYKLLRTKVIYNKAFIFSLLILGYGYIIFHKFETYTSVTLLKAGIISPVIFLIFQKILRNAFIYCFKREPEIEEDRGVLNSIYSILLCLGTIAAVAQLANI